MTANSFKKRLSTGAMILGAGVLALWATLSQAQTSSLVTAPVEPASRVVLKGQRARWALPENDQGLVPGDTVLAHLTLVLKRSPERQKDFEQFLESQQDPASPNYHRWLTPTEIGKSFGASEHDINAICEWLRAQSLRVDSVSNGRMMIDFSGSASLVGAAFRTEMRYYLRNGEQRMAAAGDPQIPAAFAGIIQSISGMYTINNRAYHGAGQARVTVKEANSTAPAATFCNGGSCSYYIFPGDFAAIYDLNPIYSQGIDGTGETVAIVGRSRVFTADIENFETLSALAVKDPTVIVPPGGVDPGPADGTKNPAPDDQLEATLDVMRSTSIAPGATIDLIVSLSNNGQDGIAIAAEYVVDTDPVPAQIMSISFGECEADAGESGVQFWDGLFSQAAGEGISVFVASGDAGAAGCDGYFQTPPQNQILSPNYICASSYSTCTGGTEFADAGDPAAYWNQSNGSGYESAKGYILEGGWNEPLNGDGNPQAASSGGGVSAYIATPSWQTGTGVPGTQGRYTPDLAFSSSAHDGYFGCLAADEGSCVVENGGFTFEYFFGTSAAAPDMAGITALLNQKFNSPQGELNQRLYQLAATPANAVFHDVTVASSGVANCGLTTPSMCNNSTPSPTGLTGGLAGYLVTAGYDEVTGLGSVDGANLLENWVASATFTISAAPTTQTISSGGSATIVVTVTPQGNYTSPITFTATVTPALGAQASFNPTTVTPNSSTVMTTLTIGGAAAGAIDAAHAGLPSHADKLKLTAFGTSLLWMPIGLVGFVLLRSRTSGDRGVLRYCLLSAALALMALTWFGCGGSSGSTPPPPQTYQVQITATAVANGTSAPATTSTTVMFTSE